MAIVSGCSDDDSARFPTPAPTATAEATATNIPATATTAPTNTVPPATATVPPSLTPTSVATASSTATTVPSATATDVPPSATATSEPTATATESPTPEPTAPLTDVEKLLSVEQKETWNLPGLGSEVQVLRTEGNVAHIYATNRVDLSFVQGFVTARDRYFMMDLTRRLGLGRVTELIGDGALDTDLESRLTGMTYVADRVANGFSSEHGAMADAFAAGVNAYIEEVKARRLPMPSELPLAGVLLGVSDPRTLMAPFTRRDIAGILAVIIYQSSFETGDVGRDAAFASLPNHYQGVPFQDLRFAGLVNDIVPSIDPFYPVGSSAGFGLETGSDFIPGPVPEGYPGLASTNALANLGAFETRSAAAPQPERDPVERLAETLTALEERLGRVNGFGSNAWALSGTKTDSGATLIAGDGHLQLDIPAIFYQIGLDTSVLGGGDTHQLGLTIPGFFIPPVGTNGKVAWSQTQLSADITDWYREQVQLDAEGRPAATLYQGEWRPLTRVDETLVIADVPLLDSVGRTEVIPRYTLFDGRFLAQVEGRSASPGEELGAGESLLYTTSGLVVPSDTNSDGIITGISFDYTAFDVVRLIDGADGFGHSEDMTEFREHSRKLIGYSQNIAAGDSQGNVFYTAYHAVPCRSYLDRNPDWTWAPGAHPGRLLDGTRYAGFEVPMTNGLPDENAAGGDPHKCLVPFDSTPQSLNPERGYILTANNDPGRIQFDGSLETDPWWIGGPWDVGFRANRIDEELARLAESGEGDAEAMARLQGDHLSVLGRVFTPYLVEAIDFARNVPNLDRIPTEAEQRTLDLYLAKTTAIDEAQQRLEAWGESGYEAASGVETFYHTVAEGETEDAVATMIFNAWIGRFLRGVWGDEPINGGLVPEGDMTRLKLIRQFLQARDAGTTGGFASHNPATGESIYFDVLNTELVESSREVMLQAFVEALSFLESAPIEAGRGGFGTTDQSTWLWGLRHQARFESLLAPFLGNDPNFEPFTRPFAIDTSKLPLAPNLPQDDPRRGLRWFPRPGDQWGVDAANPGFSGTDFTHGNGPVMRMVFALKDGEVSGYNVIPGGQSGMTNSPFFSDQARLWLANEAYPVRFYVEDVVAGATGREVYRPQAVEE
ncbi:MAG TPA: penicillin acylase family protein [Terriglobales bacterium]|nr:penicillin acylase family protein [Terriglobales bacterium]